MWHQNVHHSRQAPFQVITVNKLMPCHENTEACKLEKVSCVFYMLSGNKVRFGFCLVGREKKKQKNTFLSAPSAAFGILTAFFPFSRQTHSRLCCCCRRRCRLSTSHPPLHLSTLAHHSAPPPVPVPVPSPSPKESMSGPPGFWGAFNSLVQQPAFAQLTHPRSDLSSPLIRASSGRPPPAPPATEKNSSL